MTKCKVVLFLEVCTILIIIIIIIVNKSELVK